MDNNALLIALAISLGLTIVFELVFFFIFFLFAKEKWNRKDLLLVILVNTLTNPVVVLLYWIAFYNTNWNTVLIKIPLEIFAVLTEGFIYKKKAENIKHPFIFSLAANAVSFTLGIVVSSLFFNT